MDVQVDRRAFLASVGVGALEAMSPEDRAEELGLNSGNVDDMRANSTNASVKRMLGVEGNLHEGLGLDKDWAYNIIKQVGNYGEMYERSMGSGELGLGIGRAGSQNDLWTRGGLQYSPPFR